jgi:hypothetical protein
MKGTIRRSAVDLLLALALLGVVVTQAHAQAEVAVDADAGVSSSVLPEASEVTARLIADATELTVGDPVQLTLEVIHPGTTEVLMPELERTWGDFDVREQGPISTETLADGTEVTRQPIEAALFAPGTFRTPPLAVTVIDETGSAGRTVATPAELTVISVLDEGEATLRDIKPQATLPLPKNWPVYAGVALGVLALLLGGWQTVRRWQARRSVDRRPPAQVALDELARIKSLRLPEDGRFKEHYHLVTACLRQYLERQYRIPAQDRTTAELKPLLQSTSMSDTQADAFGRLFVDTDLVKFTDVTPSPEAAYNLLLRARALVTRSAAEVVQMEADQSGRDNAGSTAMTAPTGA